MYSAYKLNKEGDNAMENSVEVLWKTEKFFKRWEYQITWPASWEICMQVKKQQLELGIEQQSGS